MSLKHILPVAALLALIGTPAVAQDFQSMQKACMNDVKTLCAGVQPGGGRIRDCMLAKIDQISPQCKAAMSNAAQGGTAPAPKN